MKKETSDFNALEDRVIEFAVGCISISGGIQNNYTGKYLTNQLIRSGSSSALNYAEARYAESKKDFIHKIKIVLKELHETLVCLKIIDRSNSYSGKDSILSTMKECNELISIFVKSVHTAQKNIPTEKP